MQIKVKTLTGKEIELSIDPTDTVAQIKERVEEREGIPPSQQRLIYGGKQMTPTTIHTETKIRQYIVNFPSNLSKLFLQHHYGSPPTQPPREAMERNVQVKNKAVAPLQISAEQILLEAFERKDAPLQIAKQQITDTEELHEYQGRKRKEYEDALRRNRLNIGQWMRYAQFELDHKEYTRARSIFERALDVDPYHIPLWLRYIQSELKERNINHARNLLDRSVTMLPRADKLWFNYVSVEETLDNISGCRHVFERWLKWRPGPPAWLAYINMEKRYGEYGRARDIFSRFTALHTNVENWIKWAKFEEEYGSVSDIRDVYTLATDRTKELGTLNEKLLINWAGWEARQREWERARALYKFGLQLLGKDKTPNLYNAFTKFEKQYGDVEGIENTILSKRKTQYEEVLNKNLYDYDTWFSYLSLLEDSAVAANDIREIFERAVAAVPEDTNNKNSWRRYIFLWIKYAIYEELTAKDVDRTRSVYERAVGTVPHSKFTFTKIWILFAKFEIRNGNITKARKLLGQGIGKSGGGKPSLFKQYIDLEIKLKDFDNCRKLYEKYVETFNNLPEPWIDYANLEYNLGEYERAEAIFEIAISLSDHMELPELLWKKYIDMETEIGRYSKVREIYRRLVEKTVKKAGIWIAFALFELSVPNRDTFGDEDSDLDDDDADGNEEPENNQQVSDEAIKRARFVFKEAWEKMKLQGLKEERAVLNKSWLEFEESYGDSNSLEVVKKQNPVLIKKRTRLDDGSWQEYMDYMFPSDEGNKKSYATLLEKANQWKQKMQQQKDTKE